MSRFVAAVVCALLLAAAPAPASAALPPDAKAKLANARECVRAMSSAVAKVTFARQDVERYLAEWQSFDALDEEDAGEDDDVGVECLDLQKALADRKYLAWAKARRLDPKDWLLKSVRITGTFVRHTAPARAAEGKAQMEAQRRELMKSCKSMGPTACKDLEKSFTEADEMMREAEGLWTLFPAPTRAEATLLDEFAARLRVAMDGDDAGEDGESGEDAGDEDDE